MISIRMEEEVLVAVMKLIKRHFSRLIRAHFVDEEYQLCKNNIDSMYKKLETVVYKNKEWLVDFTIISKAIESLDDLKNIKCIYETFLQYKNTSNNLTKYKVEVSLSIYLAQKLSKFLEREIAFQLFSRKPFKELKHIISFKNNLHISIDGFIDTSISVSIKADEYASWEKSLEEYNSEKTSARHINNKSEHESTTFESQFSDESDLYKLGYKISGLSRFQRWDILKNKAIPQLGLNRTVQIISGLIETRKLQQDGELKYANAINEWNYDLSRLADYY